MGSRQQEHHHHHHQQQDGENCEENWALSSGKPYFSIIISKSHLNPLFQLVFPAKLSNILPLTSTIPVMITNRIRNWAATYEVEQCGRWIKRSCKNGWNDFAIDMNLKLGDACVFEVMESSSKLVKLRVQILRGDLPSRFLIDNGDTSDTPIIIE